MEVFWLISDEARVKLIQFQAGFEDKPALDMAQEKAPWEKEPTKPHIDTAIETLEDIDKIMRKPPSRSRDANG